DGIFLGLMQGLAALPGFSRSGFTITALLFRKFNDTTALKLSFLMSLPIILLGNIILNYDEFKISIELVGLLTAFIVGIVSIHVLLALARKIN
ncbi:undecaprenyl-diphosphate phosphatase, partial [Escherichia coli]|uniref:undecaprenyl-diphosphate phosphatase n=1 Tax=Escherichia coli TaxID=562 RepID=UPI00107FF90F